VFERCNTQVRYVDPDLTLSAGEFASRAATACLWQNGVYASEVDLLIYGGIAREAFEPATAAEVAGRLGATPLSMTRSGYQAKPANGRHCASKVRISV
jgi:3-oxoacyl-[acyl-carrier-protein] synthase III